MIPTWWRQLWQRLHRLMRPPHDLHWLARQSDKVVTDCLLSAPQVYLGKLRVEGHTLTAEQRQALDHKVLPALATLRHQPACRLLGMQALDAPSRWRAVLWEKPEVMVEDVPDTWGIGQHRLDEHVLLHGSSLFSWTTETSDSATAMARMAHREVMERWWGHRPEAALVVVLRALYRQRDMVMMPDPIDFLPGSPRPLCKALCQVMPTLNWLLAQQPTVFWHTHRVGAQLREALAPVLAIGPGVVGWGDALERTGVDLAHKLVPHLEQIIAVEQTRQDLEAVLPMPEPVMVDGVELPRPLRARKRL